MHGKYRGQRTRSNHTTVTQSANPSYRWGDLPMVPQWVVGWDLNPSSWTQYSPATTWEARERAAGLPEGGTRNQNSPEQEGWFLCKGQVSWPCSLKASFWLPWLTSPKLKLLRYWILLISLETMLALVQSAVIRGMFLGKRAQLFPHRDQRGEKRWPGCLQIRMCSRDSMAKLS